MLGQEGFSAPRTLTWIIVMPLDIGAKPFASLHHQSFPQLCLVSPVLQIRKQAWVIVITLYPADPSLKVFLFNLPHPMSMVGSSFPDLGSNLKHLELEAWSPHHWTTKEVP